MPQSSEELAKKFGGSVADLASQFGGTRVDGVLNIEPQTDAGRRAQALREASERYDAKGASMNRHLPMMFAVGSTLATGALPLVPAALATGGAASLGSLIRSASDDKPETTGEALQTAAIEGAENAGGAWLAGKAAPAIRGLGVRLWRSLSGADAPTAEAVLSSGRGGLSHANSDALLAEAKAGSTPAREASMILDASGKPFQPAAEKVSSPMWRGYFAHQNASATNPGAVGRAASSIPIVGGVAREMVVPAVARAAQGAYRVGNNPEALRAAVLAVLGMRDMQPMASHEVAGR